MVSTSSYHKLVSSTIIICFAATSVTSRASLTLTKALSLPKATYNNASKHSQNNLIFQSFCTYFESSLHLSIVLTMIHVPLRSDFMVGFFFVDLSSFSGLCIIFLVHFKIIHILELHV